MSPTHPHFDDRHRAITLAAIGRRAGVSKATVSKVLNGRQDVAPETRRRVQALLDAYAYNRTPRRTNETAPTRIVDLLVAGLDQDWAGPLVAEFATGAAERGWDIVPSHTEAQVLDESLTRVLARGTRGLILMYSTFSPAQRQRLEAHQIPYVVVGGSAPAAQRSITIDSRAGAAIATAHLLETGHHTPGIILSSPGEPSAEWAKLGYLEALRSSSSPVRRGLLSWGSSTRSTGFNRANQMLDLADAPTALITTSSAVSAGAQEAIRSRGMKVGLDVALVCSTDRPIARLLEDELTCVQAPLAKLTSATLDLLVDPDPPLEHLSIIGQLTVRSSSGQAESTTHRLANRPLQAHSAQLSAGVVATID